MKSTEAERYARLRRLLENRRHEIQEKVHAMRDISIQEREVRDAPEQSSYDFAQALDLALLEIKSETLVLIDDALERLRRGEYGLCSECGQSIAEARLAAIPFARLCVDCQRFEEEDRETEARVHGVPVPFQSE
jgi:DnaK suppressor protein